MAHVLHDNVEAEVKVTQPEGQVWAPMKLSQRGVSFTVEEDNLLVSGWLNISIEAIRGTDQKSTQLWIRIHDYFNTYKKPNWPERSMGSLTNRWSTIQKATNKFCGYLAQVESMHPSSTNEQDKRKTGYSTVPAANAIDVEENESMSTNLERPLGKKFEKERERKRKREEFSPSQFDEKLNNMESDRRIMMIERREVAMKADRTRLR
ncbi:uncharacterized protein LOC122310268 [Carya illinoinensis]|uniref:uncharacterized protein LOC122310268 n=1 Tax=Carya illinoinensis TaxID=32201 RepID=UPI001C720FE7|nr:uncharacterized protein LOC122310268 [Carya illinoinensis]